MTFFQTYANVPSKQSAEHRKITNAAKRIPKRVRAMMRPGPCVTFKPEANNQQVG